MTPAEAARLKAYIDAMVTVPPDGDHFAYPPRPTLPAADTCPVHGLPWEHKAGTSRGTGKPYSFWGCPAKDNGTWCQQRPPVGFVGVPQGPQTSGVAPVATGELP